MADCDMCKAEAGKRGSIDKAQFSIFVERDGKVEMQELCSGCLKRKMLIAVRDLKGELKVVVKWHT